MHEESLPRGERGSALLVTTLVLMLVALLALTSLKDAEQESTAGGRSRATARTLYAADAGVQLALSRLAQGQPNLDAFDVDLGNGTNVQSRRRTDAAPLPIAPAGSGGPSPGYGLGMEGSATAVTEVFEVPVTATYTNNAAVELEVRLNRTSVMAVGY